MDEILMLADELHGVGLHLAGVTVRYPVAATAGLEFTQALGSARLVLLAPAVAAMLPPGALARAQRAESPLVVVMPDLAAPAPDLAFARQLRAVLGIEA